MCPYVQGPILAWHLQVLLISKPRYQHGCGSWTKITCCGKAMCLDVLSSWDESTLSFSLPPSWSLSPTYISKQPCTQSRATLLWLVAPFREQNPAKQWDNYQQLSLSPSKCQSNLGIDGKWIQSSSNHTREDLGLDFTLVSCKKQNQLTKQKKPLPKKTLYEINLRVGKKS